jgi:hypothetical protein
MDKKIKRKKKKKRGPRIRNQESGIRHQKNWGNPDIQEAKETRRRS